MNFQFSLNEQLNQNKRVFLHFEDDKTLIKIYFPICSGYSRFMKIVEKKNVHVWMSAFSCLNKYCCALVCRFRQKEEKMPIVYILRVNCKSSKISLFSAYSRSMDRYPDKFSCFETILFTNHVVLFSPVNTIRFFFWNEPTMKHRTP